MANGAGRGLIMLWAFLTLTGAVMAQDGKPPIQPHDGMWEAVTSQGRAFEFSVHGNTAEVFFTVTFPSACFDPDYPGTAHSVWNRNVPILNSGMEWTIAQPDTSHFGPTSRSVKVKGKNREVPMGGTVRLKAAFSSDRAMSGEMTVTLADRDPQRDKDVAPCRQEVELTFRAEYRDEKTGEFSKFDVADVDSIEIGTAKWDTRSCGTILFTRLGGNLDVLTYPSQTDQIIVHVKYGFSSPTLTLRLVGPVEGELARSECPSEDIRYGQRQIGQTLLRLRRSDGSVFPPGQYSLEVAKSDDKLIYRKTFFIK